MIKHLILEKIENMMDINVDLLQWFIHFLIKNLVEQFKQEYISNKDLAEELHKPIIRKFEKRKVHSPFIDNTQGADLADRQLIRNLIKQLHFYYVLLIFIANMLGLLL